MLLLLWLGAGGHWVIPRNSGYVLAGVCSIVTIILRDHLPWRRCMSSTEYHSNYGMRTYRTGLHGSCYASCGTRLADNAYDDLHGLAVCIVGAVRTGLVWERLFRPGQRQRDLILRTAWFREAVADVAGWTRMFRSGIRRRRFARGRQRQPDVSLMRWASSFTRRWRRAVQVVGDVAVAPVASFDIHQLNVFAHRIQPFSARCTESTAFTITRISVKSEWIIVKRRSLRPIRLNSNTQLVDLSRVGCYEQGLTLQHKMLAAGPQLPPPYCLGY